MQLVSFRSTHPYLLTNFFANAPRFACRSPNSSPPLLPASQFKKDVWAMKRGEMIEGAITSAVTASMAIDRSGDMDLELVSKPKSSSFFGGEKSAAAASNSDLASLMVENNKLLVEQNSILQKILSKK